MKNTIRHVVFTITIIELQVAKIKSTLESSIIAHISIENCMHIVTCLGLEKHLRSNPSLENLLEDHSWETS